MSFVSAENQFALWAIMLLLVALTLVLEKSKLGQKVSGPIIIIILTSTMIQYGATVFQSLWFFYYLMPTLKKYLLNQAQPL
jgi:uncharacterized membrane protein